MIELTKSNFHETVAHGVVLVDFWSEHCDRCQTLLPELHQLEEAYDGQVTFCILNIQGNRRLAMTHKVMDLPSVVIWRDGKRVAHLSGESLDGEQIYQALEMLLYNEA